MTNKKIIYSETYKKGTEISKKDELIKLIQNSSFIFIQKSTNYDDGSHSFVFEIHEK